MGLLEDKVSFLPIGKENQEQARRLMKDFYHSDAVSHPIDESHHKVTLGAIVHNSPYVKGYLIQAGSIICGYMLLSHTFSHEAGGEVLLIEELYIEADYQGRGLGREALEWLQKNNPHIKRFRLEVMPQNYIAKELYTSLGFISLEYEQYILDTN